MGSAGSSNKNKGLNQKNIRVILGIILLAVILYTAWQNRDAILNGANVSQSTGSSSDLVVEPVEKEKTTEAQTESTAAQTESTEEETPAAPTTPSGRTVSEDGEYDSKEEVALYLHLYGHLPSNFMTKKEAEELGWSGGTLKNIAPGKSIGGDYFGNYQGLLPKKTGREYHECDIDTLGRSSRGAKRIIFSNDGLVYYTEDHYETFELLYGEE